MCRGRAVQGRAGQGRQEGCPWLGKKDTYSSAFYFCVSCPAVSLSPGISTTAQAAALSTQTNKQTNKQKEAFSWVLDIGWNVSKRWNLSHPCRGLSLCSWCWTALSHSERHQELPEAKETLASIPKGIPSHLTHGQRLWHPLACPALFIYLFYSPQFCLERLIYFSSRGSGLSFSSCQTPEPCVLGASLKDKSARVPWLPGQQQAHGRWLAPMRRGTRCHGWRARWQVGTVVFGNPQRLWGWSFTLGSGFSTRLGFQWRRGLLLDGCDGKGK